MLYKNKKNIFFSSFSQAGEIALIISAFFGLIAFLALMLLPKISWLAGIATSITIITLIVAVILLTLDLKQTSPLEITPENDSHPAEKNKLTK